LTRRINKARTPNNDRIIAYLFFLKKYRQVAGVPPKVSRRLRHPKETHRCTSCLHSLAIENCQALYVSCVSRHHKRNEGTLKKKKPKKKYENSFLIRGEISLQAFDCCVLFLARLVVVCALEWRMTKEVQRDRVGCIIFYFEMLLC